MSGGCLGEIAAALVDGELDHDARERAHRHLAHCADCRTEVDAQRRLKAQLSALGGAPAPADLTARLLALSVPGTALPGTALPGTERLGTAPTGPSRPVTLRAAPGPRGTRPPSRGAARRAARRGTAVGTALVALGAVAVVLGGTPGSATTPVDPATDSFVVQHVGTTSQVPRVLDAGLTGTSR